MSEWVTRLKMTKKFIKILISFFVSMLIFGFFNNYYTEASSVSKLGKIKNENVLIYKNINNLKENVSASSTHINKTFYIKQQTKINKEVYFLLSSDSKGSKKIGWVKSSDVLSYNLNFIDQKQKTFFIKGAGKAYSKPWGGTKDTIYKDLTNYKFSIFKVNLTESVGSKTNYWYRGTLDGKTMWIHKNNLVSSIKKSDVSRIGKIKNNGVIYSKLASGKKIISNKNYLNSSYYIKQQAKFGNELYYLVSTKPSKKEGLIGWVKSTDMTSYTHTSVNKKEKTYYIKGTGVAYKKVWGGSKDVVYKTLSSKKFMTFKVNLTEKVGGNTWYRGTLEGKTVWIHVSHIANSLTKSDTSRLGKLKNNAVIYNKLAASAKVVPTKNYLNKVFYIKQQAKFGNDIYYLISTQASKSKGLIGWVKSTEITTNSHNSVDNQYKLFYIKGVGVAYSKPWGGSKDIIYNDLSKFEGEDFYVNLTSSVGNKSNYWYRGTLNGKTVWIHQNHIVQSYTKQTKYNISFENALTMQMKSNPQTDKYQNSPAYVSSNYIADIKGEVTGTEVNLRSSPKLIDSNILMKAKKGTTFEILDGNVKGDSSSGSTKWFKVKYNNEELFVHSSLAKITGTTKENVKVYSSKSTGSHQYGTIKSETKVTITDLGTSWHTLQYDTWRSATKTDTSYYLNPTNFVKDSVQKFQFLDLRRKSGVTVTKLNNYLSDKGIFKGQGQAFIDAGNQYGINELYLVAHAMLETGYGTSQLAKGIKYKDKTVYNMYGVYAFDNCPSECGAKKAYEEGWTTPSKAILGGAQFISKEYVYGGNKQGIMQNTLYKMRWNPEAMEKLGYATHQYATDIGWAYKQVNTLSNLYSTLNIKNVILDIPVYK